MRALVGLLFVLLLGLGLWWGTRSVAEAVVEPVHTRVLEDAHESFAPGVAMELPATSESAIARSVRVVQEHGASEAALVVRGRVVRSAELDVSVAGADVGFDLVGAGYELGVHRRGQTGDDGSFELALDAVPDVPPLVRAGALLRIWARADGFWPGRAEVSLADVLSGQADVRIELERGANLSGRVVDEQGAPVGQAFLTLQMAKGPLQWEWASGPCNLDGTFVLGVTQKELVRLGVSAGGFTRTLVELEGWDFDARQDVGDVVLRRGLTMQGRLVCVHGEPLEGVELVAFGADGSLRSGRQVVGATTDVFGAFRFDGLEAGPLVVRDEAHSLGEYRAGDMGLELVSKRRHWIVKVVDEDGQPLSTIDVETALGVLDAGQFEVELTSNSSTRSPDGGLVYLLESEAWNHAELVAQASGGQFVKATVELPVDACMIETRVVVPAAVPMGSLRFALRDPAGRAIDDLVASVKSPGRAGNDRLLRGPGPHDLPAGEVRVSIGPDYRGAFFQLPNMTVVIEESHEAVVARTVELGGRASLEVHFEGALDATVEPLRAVVRHLAADGSSRRVGFLSPHGGTYFLRLEEDRNLIVNEVLPAGPATFSFSAEGYADASATMALVAGETSTLEVTMYPE